MITEMTAELPPQPDQAIPANFDYRILTGHKRTDGSWKTDHQLRMEYVQLTDGLVHKMTDGIWVDDPETGERRLEKPDVVVWLDKSARPVSWLAKDMWNRLAADPQTGAVPDRPEFRFINIDREQWVNLIDPEGVGIVDMSRVDESVIRSLRSVFVLPAYKSHGLTPEIDKAPSELDGKTIMLVDEVYASGRTLEYAQSFFKRAFPSARIGSTYWMRNISFIGGAIGNADLPVWYKKNDVGGRGIGNRNDAISGASDISTQKLGRYFLSTRLRESDPRSERLREELRQLATHPDVPVLPSIERPDQEDRMLRLSAYNGGLAARQVIALSRQIKAER